MPRYEIHDTAGQLLFKIEGPCCYIKCCTDVNFKVSVFSGTVFTEPKIGHMALDLTTPVYFVPYLLCIKNKRRTILFYFLTTHVALNPCDFP